MAKSGGKSIVYEFMAEVSDVLSKFKQIEQAGAQSFDRVGQESKEASQQIKSAFQTLNIRPFKQIEQEIQKVRQAYETLKNSGKLTGQELAAAHTAMQSKVKGLKMEMAGLNQQTGFLAQQMTLLRGILATAAFTFFTRETFQQFGEFDKQIRNVWTLTDATEERMQGLGNELKDVAKELPRSASELARATYDVVSGGVSLEDSVGVVEMASKAAIAGITDTQTAARTGVQIMNAYGKSVDDLGGIYETLFNLVKYGVTNFEEISQYIGQVVPIAKGAGVSLEELSASLAILTQKGIAMPQAVAGMRFAIASLVAPTAQTKKVMEDEGIVWDGLTGTLRQLRDAGFTTTEALGRLGIPARSMAQIQTLIDSVDELDKRNKQFASSAGVFEEATQKQLEGFDNQVKILTSAFKDLAATIGEDMAKVIAPLIEGLTYLIQKFQELPAPIRQGIEAFLGMKLAIAAIMSAKALLGIPAALGVAGTAFTTFGASVAAAGALMMTSFVGVAAFTIFKLGELIKAIIDFKAEAKDAFAFSPDFKEEAAAYEEYKDFKVKTNEELKTLDEDALQEYGNSLAKKRAYLNNTIAKLTKEEQSPFNILFGRNKAKEKAELQKQLDATEQQMKDVIARRAGVEAEMDVLVKPQAQTKESELEITELMARRQELIDQEKAKHEEIQQINAGHIQQLLGINTSREDILKKIKESGDANEAVTELMKEQGVLEGLSAKTTGEREAIFQRINEVVNETIAMDEAILGLETASLSTNEEKVGAIDAATGAMGEYSSAVQEALSAEMDTPGFDMLQEKIGIIVNEANEMYALLEGKTVKIDVADAQKAAAEMSKMTEQQKVDYLNATGSVKIMGTAVDEASGKMRNMQESTAKTAEEMKALASETPKVEFEPEISEDAIKNASDVMSKSAEQMKDDIESAMEAVRDLSEVEIVPEGMDVGAEEAKLQELIDAQQAQKEELEGQISEAQAKRQEVEAEIAGLQQSFGTMQANMTQQMTQMMAQMAVAMQSTFNMEGLMAMFTTVQTFMTTMTTSMQELTTAAVTAVGEVYAAEQAAAQAYIAERASLFQQAGTEILAMATDFISQIESVYQQAAAAAQQAAAELSKLNAEVGAAKAAGGGEAGGGAPGYATGGLVRGKPGRDKVPAMLTAEEFVLRKTAVKKYGVGFLQALNKGLIDFRGFKAAQLSGPAMQSINQARIPRRYATGGLVQPINKVNATTRAKIVNLIDPNMLVKQMAGRKGEQIILNTIRSNSRLIKDIVG